MNWVRLLGPVLGPFSGTIERRLHGRFAIKKAKQSFGHITQFIAELNETLSKNLPPGLVSSAGVSLTGWSQQGDDIISSLRLRSLRKQEMIIPLRIPVGTEVLNEPIPPRIAKLLRRLGSLGRSVRA